MEAIEPGRGDYLASIHRHLKLVEHTGETETSDILVLQGDPNAGTAPGDLRLDPYRGFQQRPSYRLAPGAEADPGWENPMASIRAIYDNFVIQRSSSNAGVL